MCLVLHMPLVLERWALILLYYLSIANISQTLSGLKTLILAMVKFPEAQKKAQEELDRVIGSRLPTLGDREELPYTSAFVEETQRWRPVFPLAIPHFSTEDDSYGKYFIPKGSIVMGNSWWAPL